MLLYLIAKLAVLRNGLEGEDFLVYSGVRRNFSLRSVLYRLKRRKSATGYAIKGRRGCPAQCVAVSAQTRGQPAHAAKYKFMNINVRRRLARAIPTWSES